MNIGKWSDITVYSIPFFTAMEGLSHVNTSVKMLSIIVAVVCYSGRSVN